MLNWYNSSSKEGIHMTSQVEQLKSNFKQYDLTFLGELVVSVAECSGVLYITTIVHNGDNIVHCVYHMASEEYNPNDIEIVPIKN